jgi:transcriptional regulator with XRE-family HTH domain
MTQTIEPTRGTPSRLVAAEIRAEMARQGMSQRRLATLIGTNYTWCQRRISVGAELELTVDDVQDIAEALGVPVQRLMMSWLPREGSNLQPAGYSRRRWTDSPLAA